MIWICWRCHKPFNPDPVFQIGSLEGYRLRAWHLCNFPSDDGEVLACNERGPFHYTGTGRFP